MNVRPFWGWHWYLFLPSWYREGVPRNNPGSVGDGKPVITTDNTGCRETVQLGVNGFWLLKKQLEPLVTVQWKLSWKILKNWDDGKDKCPACQREVDVSAVNNAMLKFMNIRWHHVHPFYKAIFDVLFSRSAVDYFAITLFVFIGFVFANKRQSFKTGKTGLLKGKTFYVIKFKTMTDERDASESFQTKNAWSGVSVNLFAKHRLMNFPIN